MDCSSGTVLGFAFDPKLSLSDFISALALLATVLLAWVASRTAMKDWRVQQRLERNAEVAGRALVAVYRMTNFLKGMARGVYVEFSTPDPQMQDEDFGDQDVDRRNRVRRLQTHWTPFDELDKEFLLELVHVEAHLGEEESKLMNEVWDKAAQVQARQFSHVRGHSSFESAFGDALFEEVHALRAKADRLLRPLVRHEK